MANSFRDILAGDKGTLTEDQESVIKTFDRVDGELQKLEALANKIDKSLGTQAETEIDAGR